MTNPITLRRDLRRTKLLSAEEMLNPLSYALDYQVDSSRGFTRNFVRSAVDNKKLYVLTVQCNQESYESNPAVRDAAEKMISSFSLKSVEN